MQTSRIVNTSINLNITDLYDPNPIALIFDKCTKKFVSTCYYGMLVTNIAVLQQTKFIINQVDLKGKGSCDVVIKITGIVIPDNFILHNCKITAITSENFIIAEHKYAKINVVEDESTPILSSIGIGMIVPLVISGGSKYENNSKIITCVGSPFVHKEQKTIYIKFREPLSQEEKDQIKSILDLIREEEEKLRDDAQQKEFVKLMYPYKNDKLFTETKLVKTLRLKPLKFTMENFDLNQGVIVYPSEDNRINARFFYTEEEVKYDVLQREGILIESKLFPAITNILNEYLFYLTSLRGFVETYKTPSDVKVMKTYFDAVVHSKKP